MILYECREILVVLEAFLSEMLFFCLTRVIFAGLTGRYLIARRVKRQSVTVPRDSKCCTTLRIDSTDGKFFP